LDVSNLGSALGSTVAGSTSDPGVWSYQFNSPTAISFDPQGYMYILDYGNDRVQKWLPGAAYGVTVLATPLNNPIGMQFDLSGNIVITDTSNHRIV
jgi:sugar lactone lactonase YvrE